MKLTARVAAVVLAAVLVMLQTDAAEADVYDTKPPSVTIVSPVYGTPASGVITVAGTAKDRNGIKKVEVKVLGGSYRRAVGNKFWAAAIDTMEYAPGLQQVKVRAWDRRGNKQVRSTYIDIADQGQRVTTGSLTTPEGTRIEINSAGNWTHGEIHRILLENGLTDEIGPSLTVKVQDHYPTQATVSVSGVPGSYRSISAIIYLKGVNSSFASNPDAILTHEFGHVWGYYNLYLKQQGDWSGYLDIRGLNGHPKLDSSYVWDRDEIIAEDYRLLFGTDRVRSQWPSHMNGELPDPRQVDGLREYLAGPWSGN